MGRRANDSGVRAPDTGSLRSPRMVWRGGPLCCICPAQGCQTLRRGFTLQDQKRGSTRTASRRTRQVDSCAPVLMRPCRTQLVGANPSAPEPTSSMLRGGYFPAHCSPGLHQSFESTSVVVILRKKGFCPCNVCLWPQESSTTCLRSGNARRSRLARTISSQRRGNFVPPRLDVRSGNLA